MKYMREFIVSEWNTLENILMAHPHLHSLCPVLLEAANTHFTDLTGMSIRTEIKTIEKFRKELLPRLSAQDITQFTSRKIAKSSPLSVVPPPKLAKNYFQNAKGTVFKILFPVKKGPSLDSIINLASQKVETAEKKQPSRGFER